MVNDIFRLVKQTAVGLHAGYPYQRQREIEIVSFVESLAIVS